MKESALVLIDLAIKAGKSNSQEIVDFYYQLDEILSRDVSSTNVRNFFDSWSDAINHDYMPYNEKRLSEWVSAAKEIKQNYASSTPLSNRKIWRECAVSRA